MYYEQCKYYRKIYFMYVKRKKTLYEKEELNNKLKDIKETEISKKVKVAQLAINNMNSIIVTMMVNATRPV